MNGIEGAKFAVFRMHLFYLFKKLNHHIEAVDATAGILMSYGLWLVPAYAFEILDFDMIAISGQGSSRFAKIGDLSLPHLRITEWQLCA